MKNININEQIKRLTVHPVVDRLIGSREVMIGQIRSVRVSGDPDALIEKTRTQAAGFYIILLMALVLSVVTVIQKTGADTGIPAIERDAYGGEVKRVEAEVDAGYAGEHVRRRATISIKTKEPEAAAIEAALTSLRERLPKKILGANASLADVSSDLDLIDKDKESGASVRWSSDREDIITDTGTVNLLSAQPGDDVFLTANIRLAGASDEVRLRAVIGSPGAGHDFERDLTRSLNGIIDDLNGSAEGDVLTLPEKTDTGVSLSWKKPAEMTMIVVPPVLIILGVLMYRRRYAGVKKTLKAMRESMKLDFPDFLAKLILLLNAGLVVTSAVARIADDYKARRREGEERVFYEELLGMEERMRASNTGLTTEFTALAMRSGQREIMRFSSILTDNIDKGSTLADKLTQEEQTLRLVRKRAAEERARVAETKLTFPMALELAAVILITIAPAVMQMKA
ncbi:MAG: hypothetical protein LBN35_04830 [Clostridiales Family XIII bacterium]|jgi:hypothetical protein|nr:hypothetical protein [Clostridiales Family XIII bacterium]